jgi:hypothetical protein
MTVHIESSTAAQRRRTPPAPLALPLQARPVDRTATPARSSDDPRGVAPSTSAAEVGSHIGQVIDDIISIFV